MSDPVVIVSAVRTPLGRLRGALSAQTAPQLGAHVIREALARGRVAPTNIDEVFMGCVLPAGQGQAPARQAARGAKLVAAEGREIAHEAAKRRAGCGNDDDWIGGGGHGGDP